MNKYKYLSVAALAICFISCGSVGGYLDMAKDRGMSKAYLDALNRWTRKATIYSQLETKLQISATFKNDDFNKAYRDEYARIYYLTEAERKRMEDMQSGFSRDFREVYFYAAMSQKDSNDFEKPNSIWTIFLREGDGTLVKPLEVRKIDKITPIMEGFYPYINKYYGLFYSLKFPIATAGNADAKQSQQIKLVFSSVLGETELVWP